MYVSFYFGIYLSTYIFVPDPIPAAAVDPADLYREDPWAGRQDQRRRPGPRSHWQVN